MKRVRLLSPAQIKLRDERYRTRLRWIVIKVKQHNEFTAMRNILNQGYGAYFPLMPNGHTPLFPGFVFAQTRGQFHFAYSTKGCHGPLTAIDAAGLPCPAIVKDDEIEMLRQVEQMLLDARKPKPIDPINLKAGDPVMISDKRFQGFTAKFDELTKDQRIAVLIHMLGREQRLIFSQSVIHAL